MVTHIDVSSAPVGGWKRTPQGGIEAECRPTRCGVLKYTYPGGKIVRELRLPEEVHKADSLASLAGAPVTIDHPRVPGNKVTPDNYEQLAKGHIGDNVRADGKFVAATVRAQAKDAVAGVDSGKLVEMSCGYDCRLDWQSGTYEGEEYDAIQRDIRYNHVALLERGRGRAGSEVGLKLDSADSVPAWHLDMDKVVESYTREEMADPITFNAADFVSRADHNKAVETFQAKVDELTEKLAKETKSRADAQDAVAPAALDKLLSTRGTLIASAKAIAGDAFKADGLGEHEIRVAALKSAGLDLTGKSPDYVTARFDAKLELAQVAGASHKKATEITSAAVESRSDSRGAGAGADKVAAKQAAFNSSMQSQYKQTGVN